tara:strand:- start:185 stop:712 length:528 start_codon:yes stop_codon:yes gene_type:complete
MNIEIGKIWRRVLFIVAAVFHLSMVSALELGESLPEVSALNQDGERFSLGEHGEREFTFIFFYPKAETRGCIMQVCSLRDAYADLSERGVSVIGVSVDGVAEQKHFHENRGLPYPLIADFDRVVIEAFGVEVSEKGYAKRQAYLFRSGVLVWKDESASTQEQAADVLAAIEELKD